MLEYNFEPQHLWASFKSNFSILLSNEAVATLCWEKENYTRLARQIQV